MPSSGPIKKLIKKDKRENPPVYSSLCLGEADFKRLKSIAKLEILC